MSPIASAEMATIRTLDDAAEQTGVARRTLQRWLKERKLTSYERPGDKRRYVDLEEIERLREFRVRQARIPEPSLFDEPEPPPERRS